VALNGASADPTAFVMTFVAGAIIAMLASIMLPEAVREGGPRVGLVTVGRFPRRGAARQSLTAFRMGNVLLCTEAAVARLGIGGFRRWSQHGFCELVARCGGA
jgi:hypothetical protein